MHKAERPIDLQQRGILNFPARVTVANPLHSDSIESIHECEHTQHFAEAFMDVDNVRSPIVRHFAQFARLLRNAGIPLGDIPETRSTSKFWRFTTMQPCSMLCNIFTLKTYLHSSAARKKECRWPPGWIQSVYREDYQHSTSGREHVRSAICRHIKRARRTLQFPDLFTPTLLSFQDIRFIPNEDLRNHPFCFCRYGYFKRSYRSVYWQLRQ